MSKLENALSSYQAALDEKMRKGIPSDLYDILDEFQRMFDVSCGIDPLLMVERSDRIPSITIAKGGTGYTSPPVLEGMTQTVTGKYFYSGSRQCGKSWGAKLWKAAIAQGVAKQAIKPDPTTHEYVGKDINGVAVWCRRDPAPASSTAFTDDLRALQETERAEAAAKAERYGMKEYPGSWPPPRMGFPPGSAY
jgi:hypothetical protein